MSFFVQGYADDCKLTAPADTAKKAFAKAVEWHVVRRLTGVTISNGAESYSISAFASAMALDEIEKTRTTMAHFSDEW